MRGAMTVRLAAAARAAPRVCRAASGAARGGLPSATIRVSPELIRATARLAQIDVRDDEVDALVRIYIYISPARRAPSTRATDGGGRAPAAPRARDVYECVARRLTRAARSRGVVPRALSLSLPAFPEQIPEFEEFLRFADSMYSADDAARDFEPTPQPTMGSVEERFRRGDEPSPSSDEVLASIVRNMPDEDRGFLRVPAVVEGDEDH